MYSRRRSLGLPHWQFTLFSNYWAIPLPATVTIKDRHTVRLDIITSKIKFGDSYAEYGVLAVPWASGLLPVSLCGGSTARNKSWQQRDVPRRRSGFAVPILVKFDSRLQFGTWGECGRVLPHGSGQ